MSRAKDVPPLDYLATLSDDVGLIQHAVETIPNRSTGYCTDDVARAFIVAIMRANAAPRDEVATRLASTYLSFLHDAQLEDGRFHNFMAHDRTWLDDVGTHDSVGRAIWAVGYGVAHAPTEPWRRVCKTLLDRSLQSVDWLEYPKSEAYAMLGLAHAAEATHEAGYTGALRQLAAKMAERYERTHGSDWEWFEDMLTYDSARLPEAMIRAGHVLGEPRFVEIGLSTLAFLERTTIEGGILLPIGNDGWYPRGGPRAIYAQQPLEAAGMIDAELAALDATGDAAHLGVADIALAWFYGGNSCGVVMANGGGCYDGLDEHCANHNMGAESTLALLAGAYAMAERRPRSLRAVQ
jgi:hypothetical protein